MRRDPATLSRHGLDVLVVVVGLAAGLETAARDTLEHADGPLHWLEVAAITATVLVLLLRHRLPFVAPAATWLACGSLSFLDGRLVVDHAAIFVAGMGAAVLLGNQRTARLAWIGLAVVLGSALVIVANGPTGPTEALVSVPLLFGIGWLVGYALRERTMRTEAAEDRARRAEQEREAAARVAVAEERTRIARELHDVVAHALSVMMLQVGAVRLRLPESASTEREALRHVEEAGRTALTEMRRLLNAMRDDEDPPMTPHPGLADLDRLARDVGSAGLEVRMTVRGRPVPLPPGVDLSAYRIVQEALTNSLRHSGADSAAVTVDYAADGLRIEVRDHGAGSTRPGDGTPGHGLVGIRERVKLFSGEMSAGPAPGGGYRVSARLPWDGAAP